MLVVAHAGDDDAEACIVREASFHAIDARHDAQQGVAGGKHGGLPLVTRLERLVVFTQVFRADACPLHNLRNVEQDGGQIGEFRR